MGKTDTDGKCVCVCVIKAVYSQGSRVKEALRRLFQASVARESNT